MQFLDIKFDVSKKLMTPRLLKYMHVVAFPTSISLSYLQLNKHKWENSNKYVD